MMSDDASLELVLTVSTQVTSRSLRGGVDYGSSHGSYSISRSSKTTLSDLERDLMH